MNAALIAPGTTVSRLASSRIMVAFLPPNSNDNFLNKGAAVLATIRPVDVPPVKDIPPTSGCSRMACPTSGPRP